MKFILTIILIFSISLADNNFEDGFEDEFEQELSQDSTNGDIFDPLSGYNRVITNFNDKLMIHVVEPFNKGYKYLLPNQARRSIHNFFENINYPVSATNNLLQLKFEHSMNETIRFLANSTLGILGLFDVADEWFGIKPHKEDFGQTLGFYGVGSGFPIAVPFFGQDNLRDFLGGFADNLVNPTYHSSLHIKNDMVSYAAYGTIRGYKQINNYSLSEISYKDLTKGAIDLYPLIRDMYEQSRNKLIEE